MAIISIAVVSCVNELATLKVLRSISSASISNLRKVIGSHNPVLSFLTTDYPLEMGIEEGQRHQQRRILEACDRLEMTGATLELGYSAHPADDSEIISRTMMLNLFETAIEQHCD